MKNIFRIENKIYIISEKILNKSCWIIHDGKLMFLKDSDNPQKKYLKIIFTNDKCLINEGVKCINFETLQWLNENISCEYVKVIEIFDNAYVGGFFATETKVGYEIIIPKDRNATPEIKKETLEEATETELYLTINKTIDGGKNLSKGYNVTRGQAIDYAFDIAVEVAKKMYSDKEVIQLLIKFNQEIREVEDVRGWFERFKKEITL